MSFTMRLYTHVFVLFFNFQITSPILWDLLGLGGGGGLLGADQSALLGGQTGLLGGQTGLLGGQAGVAGGEWIGGPVAGVEYFNPADYWTLEEINVPIIPPETYERLREL